MGRVFAAQDLRATELEKDHRGPGAFQVFRERRETNLTRAREHRVAFPAEIAKARAGKFYREQGFEMPGELRRRDIRAADEGDDVIRA